MNNINTGWLITFIRNDKVPPHTENVLEVNLTIPSIDLLFNVITIYYLLSIFQITLIRVAWINISFRFIFILGSDRLYLSLAKIAIFVTSVQSAGRLTRVTTKLWTMLHTISFLLLCKTYDRYYETLISTLLSKMWGLIFIVIVVPLVTDTIDINQTNPNI